MRWLAHSTAIALLGSLTEAALVPPTSDPFYVVPKNIGSYKPGQVIRHRSVKTIITGTTSYQLFFRTNDEQGNPDGTVTTVFEPDTPANPPRILSYQYAEDAVNLDCAPSWALVGGSKSNNSADIMLEGPVVVGAGTSDGAYVISTDFEGSKAAWLVGKIEGQGVLDGIRATINYFNLSSDETRIGLYGYSGGAHASVWASSLAESYAPELKLVGAAYGGTPVDLRSNYNLLNASPGAILAGAALWGLANGYPALNDYINKLDSPKGHKIGKMFRSNNYCPNSHTAQYAGFNFTSLYYKNVLGPGSEISTILARESLLSNVSSLTVPVPKFPRYEYHGTGDVTVPYQSEVQYVQQQCAKGANIVFVSYPGLAHVPTALAGISGALGFLTAAFENNLVLGECGSSAPIVL